MRIVIKKFSKVGLYLLTCILLGVRSIIVESAILIAIDFEWDFSKLLLLWL